MINSYMVDHVALKHQKTWLTMNFIQLWFVSLYDWLLTICLRRINMILIRMTKLSNVVSINMFNYNLCKQCRLLLDGFPYGCQNTNWLIWHNTNFLLNNQYHIFNAHRHFLHICCVWFSSTPTNLNISNKIIYILNIYLF